VAPGATARARCHNRAPVASVSVPDDAFGTAPASAGVGGRAQRPGPGWWDAPLTELPGVGPATARRAAAIGLATIADLAEHLPSRYLSYDAARPIAGLTDGEEATIRVVLESIAVVPTRSAGCASCARACATTAGPSRPCGSTRRTWRASCSPGTN